MSIEFFNATEKTEKLIRDIRFLEGNHPEIGEYIGDIKNIYKQLEVLYNRIKKDVKEKSKPVKQTKRTRRV